MTLPDFVPFPKISQLFRPVILTEKIDGTNACVHISEDGEVTAGSRTRWLTPETDNYGFARWVREHTDELRGLGPGTHFGEWWGAGIQRRYGLDHKRFSLFNVSRWNAELGGVAPPACCHVVPVLEVADTLSAERVRVWLGWLAVAGSRAAAGFMKPEGVVVFHIPSGALFKATVEGDEEPKGGRAGDDMKSSGFLVSREEARDGGGVMAAEAVNHPKHYNSHPAGVECIDVIEHMSLNVGNAVKYLWRCGLKTETPIEDLKKAAWYVNREIERLEKVNGAR